MYTNDEITILEAGFREKRNHQMVMAFLRGYGEPRRIVPEDMFCTYLTTVLAHQCKGAFAALLAPGRVMRDRLVISAIHGDLTHELAAEAPAPPPPMPAPAPPMGPVGKPPSEGLPLDEQFVKAAMERLGLYLRDAKNALLPHTFRGNTLAAVGYPYRLYHETVDCTTSTGAARADGQNKITFFYINMGGRYLLVAWGHHITDKHGRTTYKVDRAYDPKSGLEGQVLQFR